jgi:hypothetical protein
VGSQGSVELVKKEKLSFERLSVCTTRLLINISSVIVKESKRTSFLHEIILIKSERIER